MRASNQRGVALVSVLVCGSLLALVTYAVSRAFVVRQRAGAKALEVSGAARGADGKLYELMDRQWTHPDLVAGRHAVGDFVWCVRRLDARLMQITVRLTHSQALNGQASETSTIQENTVDCGTVIAGGTINAGAGAAAIGYKYDDF